MDKKQTILLTGGLGFIGSHCVVQLYEYLDSINFTLNNRFVEILIIDDLSNSSQKTFDKIHHIVRDQFPQRVSEELIRFEKVNILDTDSLEKIFFSCQEQSRPIEYIIHFAGKKAVGESTKLPILYFENNFVGSLNLIKMMVKFDCKNFIFSSTATCYGATENGKETDLQNPINTYAMTKVTVEYLMKAQSIASPEFCFISLRYFNPAGAHKSSLLGDSPTVYPNNLFPFIEQVAIGKRPFLNVFGSDYPTPDGTGVRDYIHILDLADGHIAAFKQFSNLKGYHVFNLGTGKGYSVLEIINAYSKVIGKQIPYSITDRREGDVATLTGNVDKAHRELNWKHKREIEEICQDSYNFILKNPEGIN